MATKGKITSKTPSSLTWFKNVAKSLGYTSSELVNTMTPSIGDFLRTNADYGKELVTDLRDLKSAGNRVKGAFDINSQLDIAKTAYRNALNDIKTGKLYNKDRQESIGEEDFNFDFGDDSDFGMADFEFDDGDIGGKSKSDRMPSITIKNITPPITRNSPIVKIMEQQSSMIVRTAQATTNANVAMNRSKMILDHKNHIRTLQGIQSINDNLSLLVNFQNDSMSKYVAASMKYYEDSLKSMTDTLAELKKSNGSDHPQVERRPIENASDSVFLGGGGLNARGYMDMIKKNLKEQFASNMFLAPLKMMFDDTDTLKYLAASPLSFISTKVVSALVPQFLQQSMKSLDKSFGSFFPALFMRFNRAKNSENPFIQLFGEVFGLDARTKSSVDLSKYHKGPIPFDGQTKKAITEIIPGYLRKILAALTGKEEMGFDYEQGKFRTVNSMQQEFERKRDDHVRSAFGDAIGDLKRRSDAFIFQSQTERKEFQDGIEKFFMELSKKDHLVNPNLRRNKDGSMRDELKDVYDFNDSPGMLRLFRQMILTLPKSQQMAMFGQNVVTARNGIRQFMNDAEMDPTKFNAANIFNMDSDTIDQHLKRKKNGSFEVQKGFGILSQVDKFNLSALDYLRDIKRILMQGIKVFPDGGMGGAPSSAGRNVLKGYKGALKGMKKEQDKKRDDTLREDADVFDEYDQNQIDRFHEQGRHVLGSSMDLQDMSDSEISRILRDRDGIRQPETPDGQKKTITQWLGKFFKGDRQTKFNLIREKIDDMMRKPAQLLQSVFTKIDHTMYKMIFGSDSEDEDTSFFSKTMAVMRERFRKMGDWMQNKILEPLRENLFGKEGIFTKIKDSEFMKSMRSKMTKIGEFMFGQAGSDGKRTGGLMSDTANQMMDMWDGMKYYFTGKAYVNRAGVRFGDNDKSVFSEVKNIFGNFKETMKHYLFGNKAEGAADSEKRGALSGILDGIKQGFHNFSAALFGPKSVSGKDANESFKQMVANIKQRAPKSLAWGTIGAGSGLLLGGKLGLLGSLILPGGPIGGAIVGTTVGFLAQSDRFKNWLFGAKNADGSRAGGIISKSTMDFLKRHRVGIIGGASVGVAKSMLTSFGLLPSFFLPGGPIAGAVMGIGATMLARSETFQKFMFGEKGTDGKRAGGIIQKAFGSDSKFKKILGNVGAGSIGGAGFGLVASKLGLMGALLVPGGPIGGAVIGAAAGIALSTDKWKKALFGEWDEKTEKRKGGLLGKFQNWFKLELMSPLKLQFKEISLNIREWFTENIGNPFREAIGPIKKEFQNMMKQMTDMFKKGWDSFKVSIGNVFEKHVGQPFGQFMKEKVMDPLKKFFSGIVRGVGKVFGAVLSSPFKALTAMTQGLTEKHKRQGLRSFMEDERADMFGREARVERRERGERLGLFSHKDADGNVIGKGMFRRFFNMHFDKETREGARLSERGADYLQNPAVTPEEKAMQKEKFKLEREKLKLEKEKLKKYQHLGLKYDYDNFDGQGNDISRLYDGLGNARKHIKQGRKLESLDDHTFEKLTGFSLSSLFGTNMSIAGMNPEDRTKMMDIMNGKLSGEKLRKFISAKFGLVNKQAAGTEAIPLGSGEAVKESGDKVSDAIKHESSKEVIKDDLVPAVRESNKYLSKILAALGRGREGISNLRGQLPKPLNKSAFKAIRKAVKGTDETHSHADGIDNVPYDNYNTDLHQGEMVVPADQANEIRRTAGMGQKPASKMGTGNINDSNRLVGKLPTSKAGLLARIASDVRIIASEVKGQLDGLGGNVFKIRKLIQKSMGATDEDMSGSANRDRVGFFGKLRRMMFKPFEAMRDKLMQGVDWVTGKIRAFGETVKKIGAAIISVPVNIAKGMWEFTKQVGGVIKESILSVVKIPGQIMKVAVGAVQATVETLRMVGPAVAESLKGVAKLFSGAMGMAAHAMIGFGKGVGEFFKEAGAGVGLILKNLGASAAAILGTVGKFIGNTASLITDFVFSSVKTSIDFTLSTVKMVGEKLLDVGNTMMQIVTSPLKFLANSVNKLANIKQEVVVTGGRLDSVGTVEHLGGKKSVNSALNPVYVTITGSHAIPPHVVDAGEAGKGVIKRFGVIPGGLSGSNALANAVSSAVGAFSSKEKQADELKNKRAQVSRKTADYQLKLLGEKEEKEFMRSNETKQTSLLEKIAKATTEHKDGWMAIFGPRGLLTAGLLLLLPFLKDAIAWLMGKGNDSRTMPDGSYVPNSDLGEHLTKGTLTTTKAVINKKLLPGVKALTDDAKAVGKIAGSAVNAGKNAVNKVVPKIQNSSAYQTVSKQVKTVATDAKIVALTVKDKATEVIKFVKDVITKLLNNNEIIKRIGKAAAGKTLTDVLAKIGQAFAKPNIIAKYVPRISTMAAIKMGGAALSFGTSEIVWGAWNVSTGLVEAHHLFKVNPDQVDWKMRIISSIMKGILGFGFNFVIEVLNDIVIEVFGIDFIQMLANLMYQYMSDEEDYSKLLGNQDAFKLQVEEYNKANGTNLSVDAYNDMMNKTVGQKVWDATKNAASNTWEGMKWAGGKIADGFNATVDGAKWVGGKIADGASWVGGKIADGTSWVGNKAVEVGKSIYNNTPIGAFTNDDIVKKNFNVTGNGTVTTGMRVSSGLGQAGEMLSFGLLDAEKTTKYIYGAGLKAQEYWKSTTEAFDKNIGEPMKKVWDDTKKTVGDFTDKMKNKGAEIWKNITDSFSEKLGKIKDGVSESWDNITTNIADGWSNAKESIGSFLKDIGDGTEKSWLDIANPISDGWNRMRDSIGKKVDGVVSDAKDMWDKISKPISDGWSNMKKSIGETVDNMIKNAKDMWGKISKPVSDAWESVKKSATDGVKQVKDMFTNMIDSVTSPFTSFFSDLKSKADEKMKDLGFASGGPQESAFTPAGQAALKGMTSSGAVMPEMVFPGYKVSSGYGGRRDPLTGSSSVHRGIDLVKQHRSPIPSFTNGEVVFAGVGGAGSGYSNYGNVVAIRDENGFTHLYGHLFQANMRVGQKVRVGDVVGLQGSTGRSTGSHLHYEVRRAGYGSDINPSQYLQSYKAGIKDFTKLVSAYPATGTDPEPDPSTLDLFGKMAENFSLFADNVFQGTNNKLTWGSKLANGAAAVATSNMLSSFVPKSLQDSILKKTAQLTIGSESNGNYTYGRNDRTPDGTPLSPSVGIMQWRGNNAQKLMQQMYQQIPSDPDARYFATQVNWNDNRPWSSAEQQRLENYLRRNQGLSKKLQDDYAISFVRDTNLNPVYRYGVNTGKIKDPRSIAFLGEIANTGPGHLRDFFNVYTPTTGPEFPHLYQEFMRKSYWGQKSIYQGRLQKSYSALSNWSPDDVGNGMGGPEERIPTSMLSSSAANRIASELRGTDRARVSRGRTPDTISLASLDRHDVSSTKQLEMSYRETADLLKEAVKVLKEIADNTGDTSEGIIKLSDKLEKASANGEKAENNSQVVVLPGNQNSFNANPILGAIDSTPKNQNDYRVAKNIASGRKK